MKTSNIIKLNIAAFMVCFSAEAGPETNQRNKQEKTDIAKSIAELPTPSLSKGFGPYADYLVNGAFTVIKEFFRMGADAPESFTNSDGSINVDAVLSKHNQRTEANN